MPRAKKRKIRAQSGILEGNHQKAPLDGMSIGMVKGGGINLKGFLKDTVIWKKHTIDINAKNIWPAEQNGQHGSSSSDALMHPKVRNGPEDSETQPDTHLPHVTPQCRVVVALKDAGGGEVWKLIIGGSTICVS